MHAYDNFNVLRRRFRVNRKCSVLLDAMISSLGFAPVSGLSDYSGHGPNFMRGGQTLVYKKHQLSGMCLPGIAGQFLASRAGHILFNF